MSNDITIDRIAEKYGTGLHKKRGPARMIEAYAKQLIKENDKSELAIDDKAIALKIREHFPGANTSVKCIQWYRCQMRKLGELAAAPKRVAKKRLPVIMYEIVTTDKATGEFIEDTYTSAKLIKTVQEFLVRDGAERKVAKESVYSVPTATTCLAMQGYEVMETEV